MLLHFALWGIDFHNFRNRLNTCCPPDVSRWKLASKRCIRTRWKSASTLCFRFVPTLCPCRWHWHMKTKNKEQCSSFFLVPNLCVNPACVIEIHNPCAARYLKGKTDFWSHVIPGMCDLCLCFYSQPSNNIYSQHLYCNTSCNNYKLETDAKLGYNLNPLIYINFSWNQMKYQRTHSWEMCGLQHFSFSFTLDCLH